MTDPTPRHLILPKGITKDGSKAIADVLTRAVRVALDGWQLDISRYANALTDDGIYAAQTVAISIPRQAGKTFTVYTALVLARCLLEPNTFVVWSAHHSSVSSETAHEIVSLVENNPYLLGKIRGGRDGLKTAKGREEIVFLNGSRIVFKARENGALRGVPKVRILVLDEAQIIGETVLSDVIPTLNAARNPQVIALGTPPKPGDRGDYFTSLRDAALAGETDDVFFVEYSAPDDLGLDDEDGWLLANPSFASGRTPRASMVRMRTNFTNDDDFAREALGRWDRADNGEIITEEVWAATEDVDSVAVLDLALALDVSPDGNSTSVVLAGRRADGCHHVELLEQRSGTSWAVPFVKGVLDANPDIRAFVLDVGSSSRILTDDFNALKVRFTAPRVNDIGSACLALHNGFADGIIVHTGQPQMNLARQGARRRTLGETGMWAWSRKNSLTDISPIVAATLALWGTTTSSPTRPGRKAGRRKVVVLS